MAPLTMPGATCQPEDRAEKGRSPMYHGAVRMAGRLSVLWCSWLLLATGAAWTGACGTAPKPPITVGEGVLTVQNQSTAEWRDVEIWVNDHYRVTKPIMPAGERLVVPLRVFVAGFGQRFDPARQVVQSVEVTASTRDGTPVKLVSGRGRRR